jgi:conjugal transfer/entry exclusion protein
VVLHHLGKSKSSQSYRGSSDIKAAVDTAYKLAKVRPAGLTGQAKHDRLDGLNVTNFKSRVAEGKNFSVRFVAGKGFQSLDEIAKAEVNENLSLLEALLTEEPINGTEFKEKAKAAKISREAAERFLKEWPYQRPGSKPNEKVYYRPAKEAIM